MKIVFIGPADTIHRYKEGNFKKPLMYAPLTFPRLASLIPPEIEAEVEVIDECIEPLRFDLDADLVGISIRTGTALRGYAISEYLRKKRDIPVVIGGIHATLMPEEVANYADAVVIGLAEKSLPELLRDFLQGKMRKFYNIPLNGDYSNIPLPRRDLIKTKAFLMPNTVEATKGCPNDCEFCVVPVVWGKKMLLRPIPEVIKEIEMLPGKDVIFIDLNLIGDIPYATKLLTEMIPLKRRWGGLMTSNILEYPALFKLIVKSGCRGLLIGFESITSLAINDINKPFSNVNNYKKLIRALHHNGIAVNGTFTFGTDSDDLDVFKRTVNFVQESAIDLPRYSVLTPYPKTALYNKLESAGRIVERNWSMYDVEHCVFKPKNMTPEQLENGLHWAWKQTYKSRSIISRLMKSRSMLFLMTLANIGYKIYAKTLPRYSREEMVKPPVFP